MSEIDSLIIIIIIFFFLLMLFMYGFFVQRDRAEYYKEILENTERKLHILTKNEDDWKKIKDYYRP